MDDFLGALLVLMVLVALGFLVFIGGVVKHESDVIYSCKNFGKVEIQGAWYSCQLQKP